MSDSIEKKIARYEEQYKIIEKSIVDVIWLVDIEKFSKLKMRCSGGYCPSVPDAKK